MAQRTTNDERMTRSEMAGFLREIADEMGSGEGSVRIPIGNKRIRLSPPETVDSEATVTERSRRLRKDTEELELTFRWNPTGDTAESGSTETDRAEGAGR